MGFQDMSLVPHETFCERHWDVRLAILHLVVVYSGSLVRVGFVPGLYGGKCHDSRPDLKMVDFVLLK